MRVGTAVDFLATPHLWEIYETPRSPITMALVHPSVLANCQRIAGTIASAIALLLISPELQAVNFPDRGTAFIDSPTGSNVNIRSGPGTRFPAINTLRPGTPVNLTGFYEDGWAQLTDRSWVAGNLVSSVSGDVGYGGAAIAYIAPPPGYNVNIRSGPGVQYPAVNTLAPGTAITITGRYENGWAQLADGSWVAGNLIRVGRPIDRPVPPPPVDNVFFDVGTRSPEVIRIEARLRELNYVTSNFVPDEYYGTDTAQAIRNFQRRNGLTADGIAGPQTRRVLFSSAAIPNRVTTPIESFRLGTRAQGVLPLEIRLQELNYLPLNFIPDTYYGRETEDAVRDFQRRNGLAVTGVADPQTRSLINSTAAVPGPPTSPAISPPEPEDPTDPEVPTEPEDPNPPDLGGFRDATVSTTDGLDALAFSGPGTEYDLLGFIPNGTVVTVTGETQGSWSELDNGSWIYTDFLEF